MFMETKQERERQFHNAAFSDNRRSNVVPAYAIMHESRLFYEGFVRRHSAGARMLEYGCGATAMASAVGANATEVVGIDISDVAVTQATARAAMLGIAARYEVMDAENLTFADQSFDIICSVAILHHLDLDKAYAQIARTLRPGGHAVFLEPLGHNPIINLYRRLTPRMRTPDEHPLLIRDLLLAQKYFDKVEVRYFVLASMLAVPLRNTPVFKPVLYTLEAVDRVLFKSIPWLRKQAWQVVLILSEPRYKGRRYSP